MSSPAATVALAATLAVAGAAVAENLKVGPNDTTASVIAAQQGQRVTLRLRGGQEITGIVREATSKLVVLGELAGREFFDAVVPVEAIDAVIVRTRQQ